MVKKRAYKKTMGKNKMLNKINFAVLALGLLLIIFGMEKIGYYILWVGLFILFTTAVSGILASGSLRRRR